jgi:L-amino acid N-acyltransferase YncA
VGADGGARRPLNPFLSKDPNQRAKRLARALVSDIITYHPAKHAEGLRDGTLKQLFREEIKKSFEEYIAQVGQQLAESTTYFQEALNEVLGAGKKIF